MIDPERWLNDHAPGYSDLKARERSAIAHFALLWSFFELRALNAAAKPSAIIARVDEWAALYELSAGPYEIAFVHFKNRYFVNGIFNNLFDGLNFRPHDRRQLLRWR
jgi:hypothetical protein